MRGGDTSALRSYNERLILDAIRRAGPLSKAEIARLTGLSAQAASVIVRGLLAEGLIRENEKVRGRVGQPITPLSLDPEGAFSVGVKIGRRSAEAAAVDFAGTERALCRSAYAAPSPEVALPAARRSLRRALEALGAERRARVVGLGVAMPGDMHLWTADLGLAPRALDGWRDVDVAAALAPGLVGPVRFYNDATAACAAELAVGRGARSPNMLYVYVGAFIGGGLVLDGRLVHGPTGRAAGLGAMPMAAPGRTGAPRQLVQEASQLGLEAALRAAGLDGADAPGESRAEAAFARWRDGAAEGLARCVAAAAAVVELESVVLDGVLAPPWRAALLEATRAAMAGFDLTGLPPMAFAPGALGPKARVLGAALLPLYAAFSPDPGTLAPDPGRPRVAAR